MVKKNSIKLFGDDKIRAIWDDEQEKWYFSIVDVIAVLTESPNPQTYWRVLKKRLKDEGNETVTNCNGLKMRAADGKMRLTDVADTEQLTFRDKWSYFYEYRQRLLNKMSAVAATKANWTEVSGKTGFAAISQITSSNVSTYFANAAIGAAQIGSIELVGESAFKVRTNNSAGARMDMDSRRIKIFDASGTLRVQLGDLTL